MKELRIFYDADGKAIWTHGLEGNGEFPTTIEQDLTELPPDTGCLVLTNSAKIDAFMKSSTQQVIDGKLVFGKPIPLAPIPPARDLAAEIDEIRAKLEAAGIM